MNPEDPVLEKPITAAGATDVVREQDKIHLVLAYLGILSLIPLLTVKDSEFVKYHAKHGLVIGVGGFIVIGVLQVIPFVGQIIGCLGSVALVVLDVVAMVKALRGERWRIPGVSDLAAKL